MKTTPLRPHKVLGKTTADGELHALCLTTGPFADIVFSYKKVDFEEDTENDSLRVKFVYDIHDVPDDKKDFDVQLFEKEIGEFIIDLLHYGIERDHLGYIDDEQNRTDHPFQSNP